MVLNVEVDPVIKSSIWVLSSPAFVEYKAVFIVIHNSVPLRCFFNGLYICLFLNGWSYCSTRKKEKIYDVALKHDETDSYALRRASV